MSFNLSASAKTEIKRDLFVFLVALEATNVFAGPLTKASLLAAIVTAAKVSARQIFQHSSEAVAE